MKLNFLSDFLAKENDYNTTDALEGSNGATNLLKFVFFITIIFLPVLSMLYSIRNQVGKIRSNRELEKTIAEQNFIERLYRAIMHKDINSILNMTKNSEVDLDKINRNIGETCLELAVRIGNTAIAQILLDAGANIDATKSEGGTLPITIAITMNDFKMIEFLVKNGADIQKKSHFSNSLNHKSFYLTQFEYAQNQYGEDNPKMLDAMNSLGAGIKSTSSDQAKNTKAIKTPTLMQNNILF